MLIPAILQSAWSKIFGIVIRLAICSSTLLDTVLIEDPLDQISFLFSESVTKIFHSCKEDIEAVFSWTGQERVNVFDTQLADAFLDGHYSIGYQGVVEEKLGIKEDKGETRKNWIRRQ